MKFTSSYPVITGDTEKLKHNAEVLTAVAAGHGVEIAGEKAGHIEIGSKLAELPDVLDVFDVAGNTSYIIRAVVKDTSGLNDLIIRLGNIPGVVRTQTTLIMNMIKNELAFNFSQDEP